MVNPANDNAAYAAAEAVALRSRSKLIAYLSARFGDVAAAEDALSEAFASALSAWPLNGCPDNPEAWLLTAARRKLIDHLRRSVEDQFSDGLRRSGSVQNTPDTVTRRDVSPSNARHSTDQWQPVQRQRAKTSPTRDDTRGRQNRRYAAAQRHQAIDGTIIRNDRRGIRRHGRLAGDRADVSRPIRSWENLRCKRRAIGLPVFEKQGFRREPVTGLEHNAMPFQAEHRRKREPTRRER